MVLKEAKKQINYVQNARMRRFRIYSQGFFLVLWLVLFMLTNRYSGLDFLNAFLIFDPLVQFVTIALSGITVYAVVFPTCLIILTFLTGRTFCGWICPMGTLLDVYEWFMPGVMRGELHDRLPKMFRNRHHIKYYILLITVVMAAFGYQFLLLLDPLVLLNRGLTAGLYPVLTWLMPGINKGVEFTIYGATGAFGFFITVFLLNHIHSRFWCRVLCPLGAVLGVISRYSLASRYSPDCVQCTKCDTQCPTGAIDEEDANRFSKSECVMCMDCDVACPFDINILSWGKLKNFFFRDKIDIPLDLKRRHFAWSLFGGMFAIPFIHANGKSKYSNKTKLRPPHSQADDDHFTSQCIRCWECIKSCPTNVLQPDMTGFFDLKNLWTPVFVPAAGACMTECNMCSEVCPTDAIQKYDITQKYDVKIGTAELVEDKCIGYDGKQCNKCVDVCPTNAIPIKNLFWKKGNTIPARVIWEKCIDCGWCEFACIDMVPGTPAIVVVAAGRGQIADVDRADRPTGKKLSMVKVP